MDPHGPDQGVQVYEPHSRKSFGGYYTFDAATLARVRAPKAKTPPFFLEKFEKIKRALEEEEKWLSASQAEVEAWERRAECLCSTLNLG